MVDRFGFVFYFYLVIFVHGDYFYYFDRVEVVEVWLLDASAASLLCNLMVKVGGALADLVRPEWLVMGPGWDAAVEEVDAAKFVAASTTSLNGWLGPPWIKNK